MSITNQSAKDVKIYLGCNTQKKKIFVLRYVEMDFIMVEWDVMMAIYKVEMDAQKTVELKMIGYVRTTLVLYQQPANILNSLLFILRN